MQEFQTNKSNFHEHRLVDVEQRELANGEVRAVVDRFAFTANNITYAVAGEQIRYWEFFPPNGENAEQWGIIPVWGFADIHESKCDELAVGERLFGYFLPSQELIMRPSRVSPAAFIEASEHRAELPISYNLYRRVLAEPDYAREHDNERILLYVLHLTSFCIQDMLQANNWFDAEQVVILSASSKTSSGLAYGLSAADNAPPAIGLTSAGNISLVESMGAYQQAFAYDDIESIDAERPTVIIDMSGNTDLMSRLHQHLGEQMRFTSSVGITHWQQPRDVDGIINERCQQFFAPTHIQEGMKRLGQEEWERRSFAYVMHSMSKSRNWLRIKELEGLGGLTSIYQDVCAGTNDASEGIIIKM